MNKAIIKSYQNTSTDFAASISILNNLIFRHHENKLQDFNLYNASFGKFNIIQSPTYSWASLNNNYISIFLKELPFNYEMFLPQVFLVNSEFSISESSNVSQAEKNTENNTVLLKIRLTNIEKISSIHSFIVHIKGMDNSETEIEGMKEVFLKIDELIDKNDYFSINELITSFISSEFSFQFHISLLASTLPNKEKISNRPLLFSNTIKVGKTLMPESEVMSTLQGLE